jgi:hypothetical protein
MDAARAGRSRAFFRLAPPFARRLTWRCSRFTCRRAVRGGRGFGVTLPSGKVAEQPCELWPLIVQATGDLDHLLDDGVGAHSLSFMVCKYALSSPEAADNAYLHTIEGACPARPRATL